MADNFKFPDEVEDETKNAAALEAASVKVETSAEPEIEVEVVDDTPAADRGRKPLDRPVEDPTDEELESYSERVKKRMADLTHARHDERRAKEQTQREREELQRIAQSLLEENNSLKQTVTQGNTALVDGFKSKATSDLENARSALKAAHEAFDTDKIVAAQEAMQDAKIRLNTAANFRPPPLQPAKTQLQLPQPPQVVPPDEKALRWQAKNQWFGQPGFEEVTSHALGLHQKLVNSGLDPRSDSYYEQLEARMKPRFPEIFGEEGKAKSGEATRRPATVTAPSTRSTAARKVQLTATQVALAKKFGLTNQQYAAQVAKLETNNG